MIYSLLVEGHNAEEREKIYTMLNAPLPGQARGRVSAEVARSEMASFMALSSEIG